MPLPKTDEIFPLLKEAKYFTALYLCGGYYHIKLDEESIPESAFITIFGKIKFLRLPFGLSQGPDFFICLIYDLFRLYTTSNQGQGLDTCHIWTTSYFTGRLKKNTYKC